MMRNLFAMALVLFGSAVASAESVTVANYSFEDPALDVGGWTNTLPNWDGPANAGDSFIEYIAGFKSDGVNHLGMAAGAEVSQNTGVAVKPNTTYQLTVGVGRRNSGFTPANNASRFGLYVANDAQAGGTLLGDAVYNASGLADSTFVDQTLTVTTGASVPAGNLVISLRSTGGGRAHYDNIRLTAVPEPSSLVLAVLGLLGLARMRRR